MKEFNCKLKSISPSKIINKSKIDELDNFFLILGLIFNDLKGIILFNELVIKDYRKPNSDEINAHTGEYNGMQLQIFKLSVALINEFFRVLKNNESIIKEIKFKLIEKGLDRETKKKWNSILEIALNNNKDSNNYLSKIARIRSNIVYHYDYSGTQLRDSFIKKFFNSQKDESNKTSYYSIGKTIESTRFFYCDAIIREYLNEHLKIDTLDYFKKTNKMTKDMSIIIVSLMESFYKYKNNNK